MSKSFRKTITKKNVRDTHEDDDQEDYHSRTSYRERREKRNLANAIRSKNISKLLELHDSDDDE